MQEQEQEYEVSMMLTNSRETKFTFALEPWGFVYEMEPQAQYLLVFRSNIQPSPPNTVEVEYAADHIIVYAWDGCRFAVFKNGEVLPPGAFEGPRLPEGVQVLKNMGFLKMTMNETLARKKKQDDI